MLFKITSHVSRFAITLEHFCEEKVTALRTRPLVADEFYAALLQRAISRNDAAHGTDFRIIIIIVIIITIVRILNRSIQEIPQPTYEYKFSPHNRIR